MSREHVDSESTVSGNRAKIPTRIRRELDIDDGDTLRWSIEDDGALRVQVVHQRNGTFGDFEDYDGDRKQRVGPTTIRGTVVKRDVVADP